jgi:hypothetical protein
MKGGRIVFFSCERRGHDKVLGRITVVESIFPGGRQGMSTPLIETSVSIAEHIAHLLSLAGEYGENVTTNNSLTTKDNILRNKT